MLLENPHGKSHERKEREEKKANREMEKARKQSGVMGKKEAALRGLWKLEKEQTK